MSSKGQRVINIGPEASGGAGATPDVALRATSSLHAVVDKVKPDEDAGSLAPSRHYIAGKKAEGSLNFDPLYFQHLPYPLSMALGAGSVVLTGTPEVWTFIIPDETPDTFQTYQMETSDGASHVVLAKDVFATGLEISGVSGGGVKGVATLTTGAVTYPAALTASLTPPVTVAELLMGETHLYINSLFADIGNTEITGSFISFVWKLENLQHAKQFAGALYPNGRGNNTWDITLELILEAQHATTEVIKDMLFSEEVTGIRVRTLSPGAGGGGVDWYMNIDMMYYTAEVAELDDRDGNNTLKITMKGQKDTLGNTGVITVGCDLQAL
jgi:hypothetical protein